VGVVGLVVGVCVCCVFWVGLLVCDCLGLHLSCGAWFIVLFCVMGLIVFTGFIYYSCVVVWDVCIVVGIVVFCEGLVGFVWLTSFIYWGLVHLLCCCVVSGCDLSCVCVFVVLWGA